MFSARKMAAIDSSKESAAEKYVVGQSARMMERNRNTSKLHGNTTTEKRDAVEVILASTMTMTAMRARKRVMRRARRRASRAMARSSRRASMARGTRRMMLLLISLCAR